LPFTSRTSFKRKNVAQKPQVTANSRESLNLSAKRLVKTPGNGKLFQNLIINVLSRTVQRSVRNVLILFVRFQLSSAAVKESFHS